MKIDGLFKRIDCDPVIGGDMKMTLYSSSNTSLCKHPVSPNLAIIAKLGDIAKFCDDPGPVYLH